MLPQSLWGERHLIIVAAPYLLLVSAAVWRLRPPRLRTLVLAVVVVWASVAGLREIARTDKKIAWETLTRELIRVEPSPSGGVAVYTFEGFVASPLDFYLKAAREGRFQIRTVKDIGDASGEHFWVAFRDTTWTRGQKPQEILKAEGYAVGDSLVAGTPEQRVILFPAWRQ